MPIHQRHQGSLSHESPPSPPEPGLTTLERAEPFRDPIPWYQHPLNLFLAHTLRFLGKIGFWIHDRQYKPRGIAATRRERIKMRDGYEVVLYIYEPAEPVSTSSRVRRDGVRRSEEESDNHGGGEGKGNGKKGRPCVINFHGGGFTIGSATDDSRWAAWCTANTSSNTGTRIGTGAIAVFISVEYRLSPTYPHPIPLNDSIDATLYILSHPDIYGIDPHKVVLSGFSAGGNLAIATALSLPFDNTIPKLSGIISFYPVLDFHTSRLDKVGDTIDMNKKRGIDIVPKPLPGWMTRMFDTSYLPQAVDRRDPMISPLFASNEMMRRIPNIHLCLCGADTLAPEGLAFGQRLKLLGHQDGDVRIDREVIVRVVEGVRHGWDKPPLPLANSVSEEYNAAVDSIKRWWT